MEFSWGRRTTNVTQSRKVENFKSIHYIFTPKMLRHVSKDQARAFTAGVFEGNKRSQKTFLYASMLVIDYDETNTNYDQMLKRLNELRLNYIIHTSYSHSEEQSKMRVIVECNVKYFNKESHLASVIALSKLIGAEETQEAIKNGNIEYGVDKSATYDCAKLFCTPNCAIENKHLYRMDYVLDREPYDIKPFLKEKNSTEDQDNENKTLIKNNACVKNLDETPINKDQIKYVMENLPSEIGDKYPEWMRICAGLKCQVLSSGNKKSSCNRSDFWAFKLLQDWSKKSSRYKDSYFDSNHKVWASFDIDNDSLITFATVMKLSNYDNNEFKNLYKNTLKNNSGDKKYYSKEEVLKTFGLSPEGMYLSAISKPLSKASFNNRAAPSIIKEAGEKIKTSPSVYYYEKIKDVQGLMYYPTKYNKDDVFIEYDDNEYINSYSPKKIKISKNIEPFNVFKKHLDHLTRTEKESEILLYYFARIIQNPGVLIGWTIIIQSTEGAGKSMIQQLMRNILGEENVGILGTELIESKFNCWAEGHILKVIEEINISNDKKSSAMNKLKPCITDPNMMINGKGKTGITRPNTANYISFTNARDGIFLTKNDRRFYVIFSKWSDAIQLEKWLEENPDYYKNTVKTFDNDYPDIYFHLKNLEIPDWFMDTKRAPASQARMAIIRQGESEESVELEEAIELYKDRVLIHGELNITLLVKLWSNRVRENQFLESPVPISPPPLGSAMKKELVNLNYTLVGRKTINGIKSTIYSKIRLEMI